MKRASTNTPLRLEKLAVRLNQKARQRRLDETEGLGVVRRTGHTLIPLLHGNFAKVDDEDVLRISKYWWTKTPFGYAAGINSGIRVWMHRVIVNCPQGLEVDHINGDRLDNRKANLRLCDKRQQQGNRWKSKHARTSKFKGVYYCKRDEHFAAYGREGNKNKRLGTFQNEHDAAAAYNRWASIYFGEFARLNPL